MKKDILTSTVTPQLTAVDYRGIHFEITPDNNVTVYISHGEGIQRKAAGQPANAGASPRLSADFNTFAAYGVRVTIEKTWQKTGLTISTPGDVDVRPPAKTGPEIGDAAADGWIYAGISRTTNKPFYVAPEDTGRMRWGKLKGLVKKLQKEGKKDARLPSDDELFSMFNNRAAIGGFDEFGVYSKTGFYRTAKRTRSHEFKYGTVYHNIVGRKNARLVRS
jgi:hypothetical protein